MSNETLFDIFPEIVPESDSDTDVLDNENELPPPPILRREHPSDYGNLFERDPLTLPPPALSTIQPPPMLRRELPSDYLTPHRHYMRVTPSAPLANRQVLRDISNIIPRRLAFN